MWRSEVPDDWPDGGNVFAIAVEPKGGCWPPFAALRRQKPSCKPSPVPHGELDAFTISQGLHGIRQRRLGRREYDPLLHRPEQNEYDEIDPGDGRDDSH